MCYKKILFISCLILTSCKPQNVTSELNVHSNYFKPELSYQDLDVEQLTNLFQSELQKQISSNYPIASLPPSDDIKIGLTSFSNVSCIMKSTWGSAASGALTGAAASNVLAKGCTLGGLAVAVVTSGGGLAVSTVCGGVDVVELDTLAGALVGGLLGGTLGTIHGLKECSGSTIRQVELHAQIQQPVRINPALAKKSTLSKSRHCSPDNFPHGVSKGYFRRPLGCIDKCVEVIGNTANLFAGKANKQITNSVKQRLEKFIKNEIGDTSCTTDIDRKVDEGHGPEHVHFFQKVSQSICYNWHAYLGHAPYNMPCKKVY